MTTLLLARLTGAPRAADLAALLAGASLPLAFAPFHLFPFAVLAPALLFLLWREAAPARAAWRGFLFGLGMYGVGVSWVYVSMHNFGNMPMPLAMFAATLFAAGLALFPALAGYAQARFDRESALHGLLALPALWVLFEWWRGWVLTGFPWLNLGYSQTDTPLAGFASWLGVYGVSMACALSAGLVAQGFVQPGLALRRYLPAVVLIWLGGWLAGQIEWAQPAGAPLKTALAQGNVPLAVKWQSARRSEIIERYLGLSRQAGAVDLVVWPEAAMPASLAQIAPVLDTLRETARNGGPEFVFGAIETESGSRAYYNGVVSIGRTPGTWRKQHLVPFGEYLPVPVLFDWFIRSLQIPMSDFARGAPDQPPLVAAGHVLGVTVCYEDAFGEELIRQLPGATVLVNVSEDAWFGDSLAPHQRLQMARMRAIETARPMLRAANTGPSAAIDHRGVVTAATEPFRIALLPATIQPMTGVTPYVRFGNAPVIALAIVLLLPGVGRAFASAHKSR